MTTLSDILKLTLTLMVLTLPGFAGNAYGQLISPGKLSEAHKNLEGVTNCTSCHSLGSKGISNQRCLNCHTPLKTRIKAQLGYHSTIVGKNCANCHKEHFGRTFEILKWDTTKFEHEKTGYPLIGKHLDISCTSCHNQKFVTDQSVINFKGDHNAIGHTFLGLGNKCQNCHQADSPHGDQFIGQDCQSCHTPVDWKNMTAFNHDNTQFKLLGKHIDVSCKSCHRSETGNGQKPLIQYTGLKFGKCLDCHEDVHNGSKGTQCSSCHTATGWNRFVNFSEKAFNHETTGYPLVGKHRTITCESCHNPEASQAGIKMTFVQSTLSYSYPHPKSDKCLSCHEDYHNGAFKASAQGPNCVNCHTSDSWLPTTFGPKRHSTEAKFTLTGAHLAIPCSQCHQSPSRRKMIFHFSSLECQACHDKDNPHGQEFKNSEGNIVCADCHNTDSWTSKIQFDHSTTRFPLTGAHQFITCRSCHQTDKNVQVRFALTSGDIPVDCKGCHAKDNPHHDQFTQSAIGNNCDACHSTEAFTMADFDHSRTRFPLDGAHSNLTCFSCHKTETDKNGNTFVRFRPMQITCESCHAN